MNDIEKAIDILKYYKPVGAINAGFSSESNEDVKAFNLAISALEKQLKNNWIPVSKRLPKRGIPVLVSDKQGNVCVRAITCEIKGRKYWSQNKYDVLAWMPLLEPYREV